MPKIWLNCRDRAKKFKPKRQCPFFVVLVEMQTLITAYINTRQVLRGKPCEASPAWQALRGKPCMASPARQALRDKPCEASPMRPAPQGQPCEASPARPARQAPRGKASPQLMTQVCLECVLGMVLSSGEYCQRHTDNN